MLPHGYVVVLCDLVVLVRSTAHHLHAGVCPACVPTMHMWIGSEILNLLLPDYIYLAGELAPFSCHLTSGFELMKDENFHIGETCPFITFLNDEFVKCISLTYLREIILTLILFCFYFVFVLQVQR